MSWLWPGSGRAATWRSCETHVLQRANHPSCLLHPCGGHTGGMSANRRYMPYPPEAVFAVLSDGDRYAGWVVGAHTTAETDPRWPGAGSSFAHQQGARFLHITDETTVRAIDPPLFIEMDAKVRWLLVARVSLSISLVARGSLVVMEETIVGGALRPFADILNPLLHRRNAKALERLERLAAEETAGQRAA